MAPRNTGGTDYSGQWLRVLKHAEGTKDRSYTTAFSGAQFDNNKPHPGTVYTSKSGRSSAAHGAYQFMPDTWRDANGGQNVPMTKEAQDRAALWLMQQRGGFDPRSTPISKEAVAKLSGTWASLPNAKGQSAYGQPVKSYDELNRVWGSGNGAPSPSTKPTTKPSPIYNYPDKNKPSPIFDTKKMNKKYQDNSAVGDPVVAERGKNSGMKISRGDINTAKGRSMIYATKGIEVSPKDLLIDKFGKKAFKANFGKGSSKNYGKGMPTIHQPNSARIPSDFHSKANSYGTRAFDIPSSVISNINRIAWG